MGVVELLANHWLFTLLLLLAAAGAALLGSFFVLVQSVKASRLEEQIQRARSEDEFEAGQEYEEGVRAFSAAASASSSSATRISSSLGGAAAAQVGAGGRSLFAERSTEPFRRMRPEDEVKTGLQRIAAWMRERVAVRVQVSELNEVFRAAFQYLASRTEAFSLDHPIPLYLMTGPPQSGKATLLRQMPLPWRWKQNQRTFGASNGMLWNFSEKGILLQLPGSYLLDGEEGRTAWRCISGLLQRYRPSRPIDGVVLVLPANLLLTNAPQASELREGMLANLREGLERLARTTSMRLPVYVIISKCDLVPGFVRLSEALPAQKCQEALGWTNPSPGETEFDPGVIDGACRELRQAYFRIAAEIALDQAATDQCADSALLAWLELNHRLPEFFDTLRLALSGLFASTRAQAPRMLRGIYFCGDAGVPAEEAASSIAAARASARQPVRRRGDGSARRRILFLDQLALKRIFPEWGLATPANTFFMVRHPWARTMQAAALALLLGLGGGAAYTGMRLTAIRDRHILPMLHELQRPATSAMVARQLQAMADGGERPLRSWLLPPSLFSGIDARVQGQMEQALETRVYPVLIRDLQRRGRRLAQTWVQIAADPPRTEERRTITRPEQLAEFQSLQKFSRDWLQLQDAIDVYQSVAHPDHRPSPAEAARFLHRTGVASSTSVPASSLLYRAIATAHGPAYSYARTDQQAASQVMRDLVRRLFYRWYLGNELVRNLQELTATPRGRRGERERARLTARIRQELADPLLASALPGDHRLIAPIYAITLATVHRSGYLAPDLSAFIQNESTGDEQQVQAIIDQLQTPSGSALMSFHDGHWQLSLR